jgi:hypothetical protein
VWDLGESVRGSNLTSAAIIVKELDELSDSLKTLAIELTKFFANVDGDIDGYVSSTLPPPLFARSLSVCLSLSLSLSLSSENDLTGGI